MSGITQKDVIYFILTDRFYNGDTGNDDPCYNISLPTYYHGGDFRGIEEKIPYLKELGITALWITPVYLSIGLFNESCGYHGYWTLDFEKVDPHLYSEQPGRAEGSKQYLKDLVKRLESEGIKVILDIVVNHTGYHNSVYQNYQPKSIEEGWFNRGGSGEEKGELSGLPDLNHDNPDVCDYFINNILSWIEETGIHAIRMDTVKHVEKAFWYFFKSYIRGSHPQITLIGEVLDLKDMGHIAGYQGKYDFDTLFDFPLCTAIKECFVYDKSMNLIARPRLHAHEPKGVLDQDSLLYNNANRLVTLLDNHDLNCRIKTEILRRYGREAGELTQRVLKLCLTFLFTTRGIPQLYYGTEIGMEGDGDPHNRRDMRWDVFGHNSSPHPDDLEYAYGQDTFEFTKQLIRIRKENEALMVGYLFTLYSDHFIYSYLREYKGNLVIVVINNGLGAMPWPLEIRIGDNGNIPRRIKNSLKGKSLENLLEPSDKIVYQNGAIYVKLLGKEARIYKA